MKAITRWLNSTFAVALIGMSFGSRPAPLAATPEAGPPPPNTAEIELPDSRLGLESLRLDAPEATDSLGTSLFISGTSPAFVYVNHNVALDPSAEMTLEAWVRHGDTGCQTIVGKNFTISYWLGLCNNKLRFYSGGSGTSVDGATTIPANVWTHIAITWRSGGERVYYINGQEEYRGPAGSNGTSAWSLGIGYDNGGGCCAFKGNLAEVRLWNIERTADDIRRTMHVRLDEPRPGLVANWHLNDSFLDSVGGFHGAAGGAGTLNFTGPQPPPRPPLVPIDKDFARLPSPRDGFGFAVLSNTNRALMVGGFTTGGRTGQVHRLDLGSGNAVPFGAGLPDPRYGNTAAYAP
ncbi:MAG: LamG domain-containing protein, partial [Thermoflexales bacterium]